MRFISFLVLLTFACGDDSRPPVRDAGLIDTSIEDSGRVDVPRPDAPIPDSNIDATCVADSVEARVELAPVDIIWMVDNSASMEPAVVQVQAGLNDFASLIGGRSLDYRVIMLSLRGMGQVGSGSSRLYRVCIPPPLAGDGSCGDGERFFHVDVDVKSTQPLEQFLGTLGQTRGYEEFNDRGSAPWQHLLRPEATKTIVIVSDDNSRLEPDDFERFRGGSNPFNSNMLPPGILDDSWDGLFEGYTFSAIYGWGDESDASVRCRYPDDSTPPASGETYTTLVNRTSGPRAQLCAGPSAWGPFFDAVATAVERTTRVDCDIPIPDPPDGEILDPSLVNVRVRTADGESDLGNVGTEDDCGPAGGWAYDNPDDPSSVRLCPATCDAVQASEGEERGVDVQFGCATRLI